MALLANGERPSYDSAYGSFIRSREPPPFVTTFDIDSVFSPRVKTIFESVTSGHDMSIVWNYQHGTLTVKAFYTGSAFVLSDPIITVTVSSLMGFMISVTTSNMWSPLEKGPQPRRP